jgi:hypothetical protein
MGGMPMSTFFMVLFPLLALALLLAVVVAAIRAFGGSPPHRSRQDRDRETRLIQEIFQGLSRMEKKVEALETIVLDKERMEGNERDIWRNSAQTIPIT